MYDELQRSLKTLALEVEDKSSSREIVKLKEMLILEYAPMSGFV